MLCEYAIKRKYDQAYNQAILNLLHTDVNMRNAVLKEYMRIRKHEDKEKEKPKEGE